jgi:hypothetical protein
MLHEERCFEAPMCGHIRNPFYAIIEGMFDRKIIRVLHCHPEPAEEFAAPATMRRAALCISKKDSHTCAAMIRTPGCATDQAG